MMYAALLRGINVGGKNKVDMKELKQVVEQSGMVSAKTYINSGNIIFIDNSGQSKEALAVLLEGAIHDYFNLQIKVLLVSKEEFEGIVSAIPDFWTNGEQLKSDVLFLWDEVDTGTIMEELPLKPDIDHIVYVPGALLWSVDRENVTRSGMAKIIGTSLYKKITIRNVNTVRKLWGLMQAYE